ncbi:hypothetical protein DVR12_19470 [Chitinophaga silvatica]|uniref:Thioredoxin domain-containing protein n=1 Tax=Chitinophaga silvatica TaxID=2282649 RepID=A0A3E1Y771_9BACT|nr:thioredoxin fold domain-containing protein [Chitinophaga silvatica]RFS20738.1 hypothetical protein DVR12_19470 [Chitinophaga silvatica]
MRYKIILVWVGILISSAVFGWFGRYYYTSKLENGISTSYLAKFIKTPMPRIEVLNIDSVRVRSSDLFGNAATVILLFDPYCPHCHDQIKEILVHQSELMEVKFCLITPFPFYQMHKTYDDFQLKNMKNIFIGVDDKNYLLSYYNITGVPSMLIFDKDRKLIKAFLGGVNYKEILSAVE